MEHETGGVLGSEGATSEELEPGKASLPESEADESGEDSSDDEIEPKPDQSGRSGADQEVPAAVRKLYDSFTGAPQLITQSRTRSRRDAALLQAPMRAVDVRIVQRLERARIRRFRPRGDHQNILFRGRTT